MAQTRTIDSINVVIARDSVGDVPLDKYIDRLITECYEMPGVVVETEIDVNPGDVTSFQGCINGEADKPEALSEELREISQNLLEDMRGG